MSKLRINLDGADSIEAYDNLIPPVDMDSGVELRFRSPGPKYDLLGIIGNGQGIQVMEELHADGAGSFRIAYSQIAQQPNLFNYQNIVQVVVNGTVRAAWIIRNKSRVLISDGEEGARYYEVSGPGLRDWFNAAIVYPENPDAIKLSKLKAHTRYFNFGSRVTGPWYKKADWSQTMWTKLQSNLDPWTPGDSGGNPWRYAPIGIPDSARTTDYPGVLPKWIWPVDPTPEAPKGSCYFRHTFEVDKTGSYMIYATGDNTITLYIDGVPMINQHNTGVDATWRHMWSNSIDLNPGTHVIAAKVTNYQDSNPAAFLAMLKRVGDGKKNIPAVVVTVTGDDGWHANAYPDKAPGWSPGEVLLTLLQEAQKRGVNTLAGLKTSFTKTHDSNGDPWQYELDYSFDIGTSYYDVVNTLESLSCDVYLDPSSFKLHVYNKQGVDRSVQTDKAQPVIFARALNVTSSTEDSQNEIINTVLLGYGTEKLKEVIDPYKTIKTYGRRETYLTVDANLSDHIADSITQYTLEARHQPTDAVSIEIGEMEANVPWKDFKLGDWVLAPHTGGGYRKRRVISIAMETDGATGRPLYSLELDSYTQDRQDAIARYMQRRVGMDLAGDELQGGSYSGGGSVGGGGSAGTGNTAGSSDGTTVGAQVDSPVIVQPSAPDNPVLGQLWFDSTVPIVPDPT